MSERHADGGAMFWSLVSWGAALGAAIIAGFIFAGIHGTATGLIVFGVTFIVLGLVLAFYLGPKSSEIDAHQHHAYTAPPHEPVAPVAAPAAPEVPEAPEPEVLVPEVSVPEPAHPDSMPTGPEGSPISQRVRDAARAAGAAARAAAGLDDEPEAEPMATPVKPAALPAPRDGGPDDLKKIKGVGPKLEELLHSLGYYHFDQIAAWGPGEIAWVDSNLEGFNGRATRDDWVGQAKTLAEGGETEFSQRVDKGEVY